MLAGRAVGGLLAVVGGGESPQRPTLEPMSSKGPAMLGWLGGKGKSEKREKKTLLPESQKTEDGSAVWRGALVSF